jgi:imidazoleglycerol phosphate synthase glutamine amidotransferase subunit HisH
MNVDYSAGNLRSVARAVERVGWQACACSSSTRSFVS